MSSRLPEYGNFIVEKPNSNTEDDTMAISDAYLARFKYSAGRKVVVSPAEVTGKPFMSPDHYTVFNPHLIGRHGLKAMLEVQEEGRAKLTIDTVPPIEAEGVLVRLDPEKKNNTRPDQLTFVSQQDFDKGTSALRDQRVNV